jgi:hypothetical protein
MAISKGRLLVLLGLAILLILSHFKGCVGVVNTQPTQGLPPMQLFFRFHDDVSTYRFMTDTDGKLM